MSVLVGGECLRCHSDPGQEKSGGPKVYAFHGAQNFTPLLFSKCRVEDAVVGHHGQPDHNGNKCYL